MFSGQSEKVRGAKQTLSLKAGAERRQRNMISVRQKAHGYMMKHAREDSSQLNNDQQIQEGLINVWAFDKKTCPETIPVTLLPEFVRMIMQGESERDVFHGTLMIRKLLSVERYPPHEQVVQSGVIPYLVSLLDCSEKPDLQFEAAWALTNIAAGTTQNVAALVEAGAIPRFVALLRSENMDCRDQGAWAIGNVAGDGVACRNVVLQCDAIPALLHVLSIPNQPFNVVRNATWAISNLCRGKPSPSLDIVAPVLPTLAVLLHHKDVDIVCDAAWAISFICDGLPERVQAVINSGVVPRMVELLLADTTPLQTAAVRTIGNIASGEDVHTQVLINCGVLSCLGSLLVHRKRDIRKETCWTISNIAAGNAEQIDALIASNVFPLVIRCLQGQDADIKKEAAWSVANVTLCGMKHHLMYLLDCNIIPPLCDVLTVSDSKVIIVVLEALGGLLQHGEKEFRAGFSPENMVARAVIECGGLELIERMQNYSNNAIYEKCLNILEKYFAVEDGNFDDGFDDSTYFSMNPEEKHGTRFEF